MRYVCIRCAAVCKTKLTPSPKTVLKSTSYRLYIFIFCFFTLEIDFRDDSTDCQGSALPTPPPFFDEMTYHYYLPADVEVVLHIVLYAVSLKRWVDYFYHINDRYDDTRDAVVLPYDRLLLLPRISPQCRHTMRLQPTYLLLTTWGIEVHRISWCGGNKNGIVV